MIRKVLISFTILGLVTGSYLVGKTVGESKALSFAYRIDHLEKRIGEFCVENNGKNSGFSKAMQND